MSWSRRVAVILAAAVVALAGCGFHLRGQATYHFDSVFVNAPGAFTNTDSKW